MSRRRKPLQSSVRRIGILFVSLAVVATLGAPPASSQEVFDELSGGDWTGEATATGKTETTSPTRGKVVIDGAFRANLSFVVPIPSGPTTGSWEMAGSTEWTFIFPGQSAQATGSMVHEASGAIEGDRKQFGFGASTITSDGALKVSDSLTLQVNGSDPLDALNLTVSGLLCDDAWGEWALSWNIILEGEGLTPTFTGQWHALRTQSAGELERRKEIVPEVFRLQARTDELLGSSSIDGVPIVNTDLVFDLLVELTILINEFNNLGLCDQALLGTDRVNHYINTFSNIVRLWATTVIENFEIAETAMDPESILELATLAASVAAAGEGSTDQGYAQVLEQKLRDQIQANLNSPGLTDADRTTLTVLSDHLGFYVGGGFGGDQ